MDLDLLPDTSAKTTSLLQDYKLKTKFSLKPPKNHGTLPQLSSMVFWDWHSKQSQLEEWKLFSETWFNKV
jgi:hypothetical protein